MVLASPSGFLRGHKGAVNCLASAPSSEDPILVSGSNDSTCRIWDLRSRRVTQCIAHAFAGEPVNSVAFGVSSTELYVASVNQVYQFDLRQSASALIVTEASTIFEPAADEINCLHVHPTATKKPWLAVPDDEGEIGLLNMKTHAVHTLRGQHTNICTSAVFRPRCAGYDLVSGGLDCQLVFWEVKSDGSGGRMRFKMNMQSLEAGLGDATQMWNPPFVYKLAFSANGRSLAAALGDGSIALVDFASRSLVRKLRGHHAIVSDVQFFTHHDTEYVIAAGNDAKLSIWSLETALDEAPSWIVPHANGKPNAVAVVGDAAYVGDMTPVISVYALN
ncbi:Aste57867_20786 [Aphanomyces stellatus]|uniref:Aste57867_20786 protein n=1 Tax=Aphanomyces stellatus TaxID=120398 RepID=A0A485LFY5_9STRA|nr:hypothetical protein As57867_020718 [Aphanomyces stellatus]VFT97465.1 Aste57867_20786 [Aphanomyces stellatus]